MGLQSVSANTLQESVFDELFDAIVTGVLPPGERVTIRSLAEKMQVSVMPVREALRRLEALGCISSENRKFRIKELSIDNLNELYELRIMLETKAVGQACQKCTDADIAELEKIHDRYVAVEGGEDFLAINKEFHFYIYNLSRSPMTLNLIGTLWDRVSPYLYILSKNMPRSVSRKTSDHHSGMIEALKSHDEQTAKEWLERDLTFSLGHIIDAFKQGQFEN